MSIHEFLLKVVISDIAKLEKLKGKDFPNPFKSLKKLDNAFPKCYKRNSYAHLLLLLGQLVPIVVGETGKLKKYKDYLTLKKSEKEKLKEYVEIWAKVNDLTKNNGSCFKSNEFLYYGMELTDKADDRIEPKRLIRYLQILFPDHFPAKFKTYKTFQENLDAVVLIIHEDYVMEYDDSFYMIKVLPLSQRRKKGSGRRHIRSTARYGRQYSAFSRGTGFFFKVDKNDPNNHIATAAHVFRDGDKRQPIQAFYFIQNFDNDSPVVKVTNEGNVEEPWMLVPKENVYRSKSGKIHEKYNRRFLDWALVEIDRNELTNQWPSASVKTQSKRAEKSMQVYGVGHGLGLSKKLHLDAQVTYEDDRLSDQKYNCKEKGGFYFNCCLDFFSGNSGSPIFEVDSNKIVGILTHGKEDFVENGPFLEIAKNECREGLGEQCQHICVVEKSKPPKSKKKKSSEKVKAGTLSDPSPVGDKTRINAPYIYLAKHTYDRHYSLFVMIPLDPNTDFELVCPKDNGQPCTNNSKIEIFVKYKIKSGTTKPFFFDRRIIKMKDGDSPAEIMVNVQAYYSENDFLKNAIELGDVSAEDTIENTHAGNKILDAPYAYLTKPLENAEETKRRFYPRVLIMSNYIVKDMDKVSADVNGNITAIIELKGDQTGSGNPDQEWAVNSKDYLGGSEWDNGAYEATVKPKSTTKKRKAKIRNLNADTKPLNF